MFGVTRRKPPAHRLVSRAVFAQTDGVVGVDHHLTLFHQRAIRTALRAYSTNIRKVEVYGRKPPCSAIPLAIAVELAHAVVDVVPGVFVDRLRAGPQGQVGRREICGAAENSGSSGPKASMAFCEALRLAIFAGLACSFAMNSLAASKSDGISPFIRRVNSAASCGKALAWQRTSHSTPLLSAGFFGIPLGIDVRRDVKRACSSPARVRAISASPSGAVEVVGTGFVRRTETDDGFAHQQGRFVGDRPRFFYRAFDGVSVVTVHAAHHVPAVGFKAFRGVVGEPAFNVAVDGDAVVIIERHQFTQFQGTGVEHTS